MREFGICSLSIVPVRAEPSDRAEIVTQLIFGDLYELLEYTEDRKWVKVKIQMDNYEGWIDVKQTKQIEASVFEKLSKSKKLRSYEPVIKEGGHLLVAGSTFYLNPDNSSFFGEFKLKEGIKDTSQETPDNILPLALSYLNTPYLWGGKSHFGIDCSGFVQQVYGINGYFLPRDAWQQEQIGRQIEFRDIQPNDLAFFSNAKGRIIHVGIAMNDGKIIHASGQVRIDILDEKGIFKKETNEYTHYLTSVKRII
jgi:gamma-D-glutamyl-L-lysine dipeptidyl-peptidase